MFWSGYIQDAGRIFGHPSRKDSLAVQLFIHASNEPSEHACLPIWRLHVVSSYIDYSSHAAQGAVKKYLVNSNSGLKAPGFLLPCYCNLCYTK